MGLADGSAWEKENGEAKEFKPIEGQVARLDAPLRLDSDYKYLVELTAMRLAFASVALDHVIKLHEELGCINGDQVVGYTDWIFEEAFAEVSLEDTHIDGDLVDDDDECECDEGGSLQEE